MRRSLLAASLIVALVVVVLSPLVQANHDDDLFITAVAWYDDNTKQQCDLSDCQCMLNQAKLASEVVVYAKAAMATHKSNHPMWRIAHAWVRWSTLTQEFWIKWHCPAQNDDLTPEQIQAKGKAWEQILAAYIRFKVETRTALNDYENAHKH